MKAKKTTSRKPRMTREQWLEIVLHKHLAPRFKALAGAEIPTDAKVSVGFPGGGRPTSKSGNVHRIGEAWPRSRSSLRVNELFLSPTVKDPMRLLDVLVHEAVHTCSDNKDGHGPGFRRIALAVGLEGKMKATVAGKELTKFLEGVMRKMPKFAYGSLDISKAPKQSTRMIRHECNESECGAIWRAAAKWEMAQCPCCGSEEITSG